jgi:hypothetical protein
MKASSVLQRIQLRHVYKGISRYAAVELVPGELERLKVNPFLDLRNKSPNKLITTQISVRKNPRHPQSQNQCECRF